MPDSPTSEVETAFVCACEDWMRDVCDGKPTYKTVEGKSYCVLHFPGKEKSTEFKRALQRKLDKKNFDFRGVWFPDELHLSTFYANESVNLVYAIFKGPVYLLPSHSIPALDFSSATFCAEAYFSELDFTADVDFSNATFCAEAHFNDTDFKEKVDFRYATFQAAADFSSAAFPAVEKANFSYAEFQEKATITFKNAVFGKVDFSWAKFNANVDFRGANFTEADFIHAYFMNPQAGTLSSSATLKADFGSAVFSSKADFTSATFDIEGKFDAANFKKVSFNKASFNANVNFSDAIFGTEADFKKTSFKNDVNFEQAVFEGYVKFGGDVEWPIFGPQSSLNLQFAKIDRPNRVSFDTMVLRPHWLTYVDSRDFDFLDVRFRFFFEDEIKCLKTKNIRSPQVRLTEVFRDLATNCENNDRFEEALEFRYWALDARRRLIWRGFGFWKLAWWYWLASGYSEKISRALFILAILWIVAAGVYTRVGFTRWESKVATEAEVAATRDGIGVPLKFGRALTYSAGVMTLQKPEPKPATIAGQTVVLLETILGPVQAALLALAIRRKFMR